MRHYFITTKHDKSDYFKFEENFLDEKFVFNSCDDVFSKDKLDYGSLVLVKTIIKNKDIFSGKVLDMCCGYGTIGILLNKFLNLEIEQIKSIDISISHSRDYAVATVSILID